jgi:hypothetical protein
MGKKKVDNVLLTAIKNMIIANPSKLDNVKKAIIEACALLIAELSKMEKRLKLSFGERCGRIGEEINQHWDQWCKWSSEHLTQDRKDKEGFRVRLDEQDRKIQEFEGWSEAADKVIDGITDVGMEKLRERIGALENRTYGLNFHDMINRLQVLEEKVKCGARGDCIGLYSHNQRLQSLENKLKSILEPRPRGENLLQFPTGLKITMEESQEERDAWMKHAKKLVKIVASSFYSYGMPGHWWTVRLPEILCKQMTGKGFLIDGVVADKIQGYVIEGLRRDGWMLERFLPDGESDD